MYTVRRGDTLSHIARKQKTSVKTLMSANPGIKNANRIRVGQQINLPGVQDTFEASPASAKGSNPQGKVDGGIKGAANAASQAEPQGVADPKAPAGPRGSEWGRVGANGAKKVPSQGIRNVAAATTSKAGVPASWATSPALWKLLGEENDRFDTTRGHDGKKSTAFGMFQFLNKTWKGTGIAKTTDPEKQFIAGYRYIRDTYKTPERAWAFWQKHRWY
jgi:LysM repeat protein